MIFLTPFVDDKTIKVYKLMDDTPFYINKYQFEYNYGHIVRNTYLVNNTYGNFVLYKFEEADGSPDFELISKTRAGQPISGAKNFIHDVFIDDKGENEGEKFLYILTECGDIYKIDINTKDCYFERNIDILSKAQDDERGYAFYRDADGDFVISSNARLVYPDVIEYPVNLELPRFPFPGTVVSAISRAGINLSKGAPIELINDVRAVTAGAIIGCNIKKDKTDTFIIFSTEVKKTENYSENDEVKISNMDNNKYMLFNKRPFSADFSMKIVNGPVEPVQEQDNIVNMF